jgi:hypothetical protein
MITEVETSKGSAALTSDHWHVVHSRFTFRGARRPFLRGIHSEWGDRKSCRTAAKALRMQLNRNGREVPETERDEVFVRKPNFKTLKVAKAAPGD